MCKMFSDFIFGVGWFCMGFTELDNGEVSRGGGFLVISLHFCLGFFPLLNCELISTEFDCGMFKEFKFEGVIRTYDTLLICSLSTFVTVNLEVVYASDLIRVNFVIPAEKAKHKLDYSLNESKQDRRFRRCNL